MPSSDPHREQVLVLGAGPCGLGIARQLVREHGLDPLVVDRAEAPAASWRALYDGFRLNTCGFWSHLPGRPIPRRYGRWPSRDDMVAYFDDYVRREGLRMAYGITVSQVTPTPHGWRVATDRGDVETRAVVVALGNYRTPRLPAWPGLDEFAGEVVHSADYRTPQPYAGRDVLVVGSGNSATDIALQLLDAGAARVRMAVRTPPHLVPRAAVGIPIDAFSPAFTRLPAAVLDTAGSAMRRVRFPGVGRHGLRRPRTGMYSALRERHQIPTIADRLVPRARAGDIEIVPAVAGFARQSVLLDDGRSIRPDAVVAATGYTPDLTGIVGVDLLAASGAPRVDGPRGAAPGLWFAGYSEPLIGPLRHFRRQASPIAAAVAHHLAS
jgi:putative flavoprotein involved in K+ transport